MKIKFWLCCLLAVMCCTFTGCKGFKYYSTNEEDYTRYVEDIKDAKFHMPQLMDLGNYESIVIARHKPDNVFINTTDSIALFVTYSAEQFDGAMTGIQQNYEFLTETDETMQDIYAEINGYHISVVDKEIEYEVGAGLYDYGYAFLMIGYKEEAKTIVYMFHFEHTIGSTIEDLDWFIRQGYYFPSKV